MALSALRQLPPQPAIFPAACVRDYRDRTEALRALANHDLLRHLSGYEEQDAAPLHAKPQNRAQLPPLSRLTGHLRAAPFHAAARSSKLLSLQQDVRKDQYCFFIGI